MGIYKPKGQSLVVPGAAGDLASVILGTQSANLLGYYKCDDASSPLVDSSGSGNDVVEVGTGHTYGISGQVGDAVNGNFTGGWNNAGSAGALTPFLPGDNGATMIAIVRPQGALNTDRLLGFGSTEGCFFEILQLNTSGNRSIQTNGTAVSSNSVLNNVVNLLPDTGFHLISMRAVVAGVGGPNGPDDLDVGVDTDTPSHIDDTTWRVIPQTAELDDVAINSVMFNDTDFANYGGWDIQHVAFWGVDLTDSELSAIATAAGL